MQYEAEEHNLECQFELKGGGGGGGGGKKNPIVQYCRA